MITLPKFAVLFRLRSCSRSTVTSVIFVVVDPYVGFAVADGKGWAPICEFLNLPVPEVPFPKVNDTAEFQGHISKVNYGALFSLVDVVF
jgi:hypothetical protein